MVGVVYFNSDDAYSAIVNEVSAIFYTKACVSTQASCALQFMVSLLGEQNFNMSWNELNAYWLTATSDL